MQSVRVIGNNFVCSIIISMVFVFFHSAPFDIVNFEELSGTIAENVEIEMCDITADDFNTVDSVDLDGLKSINNAPQAKASNN